jgi:hypothetical protein
MTDMTTLPKFQVNDTISFLYKKGFGTEVVNLILDSDNPYRTIHGKVHLVGFYRYKHASYTRQLFAMDRITELRHTK